jgi:hypothetical protein
VRIEGDGEHADHCQDHSEDGYKGEELDTGLDAGGDLDGGMGVRVAWSR